MDRRTRSGEILKNVGFTLLSEGKTIRIKAHGYSMYPSIKPGSLILIEPIKIKGNPVPGEIIAIKRESGLIVHRLTRIVVNNGITTYIARGDSKYFCGQLRASQNLTVRRNKTESDAVQSYVSS